MAVYDLQLSNDWISWLKYENKSLYKNVACDHQEGKISVSGSQQKNEGLYSGTSIYTQKQRHISLWHFRFSYKNVPRLITTSSLVYSLKITERPENVLSIFYTTDYTVNGPPPFVLLLSLLKIKKNPIQSHTMIWPLERYRTHSLLIWGNS